MQPSLQGSVRGSYRLVRRLGTGGTGEVWVGRHIATNGVGAVKIMRARRSRELHKLLFVREGAVIARLSHPHIVRLFELGPEHIVTALVDGSDLQRRLRSGIDAASAVRIARQIGSALAYAHGRGVVHRDVKPGNILVDRNGNAFLTDFGLARLPEDLGTQVRGGTPGFMAPEQAVGDDAGPAADQYALARTLIELLAGGTDGATIDRALAQVPPSAQPLLPVLRVATDPQPRARWPSMDEFVARLSAVELRDVPPAVQRANERRVRTPFLWAGAAACVEEVAPSIMRADYTLSALESAGLLRNDACDAFRAATGYADFGWSLYARCDRLGPIEPAAVARAAEQVVFLHGWLWTRAVWHDLALAVCRDNADALVLAPDVNGFGESRFTDPPRAEQLAPRALAEAVLAWLTLLGLRELPGVLVGHSMSSLALLTLDGAQLGERLVRITIAPAVLELVPLNRAVARFGATLLRWAARSRLMRRFAVWIATLRFMAPGLGPVELASMRQQLLRVPAATLAMMVTGMADTRLPPHALRGVEVVFGARDPTYPKRVEKVAIDRFDGNADRVHHMASGAHYPHLPSVDHPEWSARNQDELVRIIGSVLLSCVDGPVASTLEVTPSSR